MKRNLTLLIFFFLYSCGGNKNPITSPTIDYYIDDQTFIDELDDLNASASANDIIAGITTANFIDTTGIQYYKIKELDLSSMELDTIPPSINVLDSIIILNLNNNNIESIPSSICDIYYQLNSLDITNNDICTPTIPNCIDQSTTISEFYSSQGCDILPDEGDRDFIFDLIDENWTNPSAGFIDTLKNIYTLWEDFREENILVSRITEIRYENQGITKIPQSIADLDSLERLELQKNQIGTIPSYIGNLSRLKYFHIFENNITSLPPKIGLLSNLKVFKIYENNLAEIHPNIGGLTNLITLWLSENQLMSLPDSMCYIITNPGIDINIDNNKICTNYHTCFDDLVNYSDGQDCSPSE